MKHFNFHIYCLESEIESLIFREEERLLDQSVIAFSDVCLPPRQSVLVTQAQGGAEYHLNG